MGLKPNVFSNSISWHEDKKHLQVKKSIDLFVCLCYCEVDDSSVKIKVKFWSHMDSSYETSYTVCDVFSANTLAAIVVVVFFSMSEIKICIQIALDFFVFFSDH